MAAAETSSNPIHSQGLLLAAITTGVLVLAVYLTQSIIENENGGISAAVRTIGICLAILSFVRPKIGLYIITTEAFTVDYIKKVAVYYGSANMGTIIEVLVVTMLAVVGTILGVLIQSVALRRYKIAPLNWAIFVGTCVLGGAIMLATMSTLGFEKAGESAFNAAVFIALALPMATFLYNRDELNKLLRFQFWFAVFWSIWGIKQYYLGFSPLEWFYAETGLSAVASEHMLKFANPRPFGPGSGAPNYGVISPYFVYGLWHLWQYRRKRLLYGLGTLIVFWGLVTSQQRTALLFPPFVLVFYFCFQTKQRALFAYIAAAVVFVIGVISSDYLLEHLDVINTAISFRGEWAESVLNVNTFSNRLMSWQLLKSPAIYSLFGNHLNVDNHDVFTKIILSYGIVGLGLVILGCIVVATYMHRSLLRIADPDDRNFATFLLAATVPYVALGFAGGGNFATNPTNLQIWTFFGAAVSLVLNSELTTAPNKVSLSAIRDMLDQHAKRPMALGGPTRTSNVQG